MREPNNRSSNFCFEYIVLLLQWNDGLASCNNRKVFNINTFLHIKKPSFAII